jgi:hypothetical protein
LRGAVSFNRSQEQAAGAASRKSKTNPWEDRKKRDAMGIHKESQCQGKLVKILRPDPGGGQGNRNGQDTRPPRIKLLSAQNKNESVNDKQRHYDTLQDVHLQRFAPQVGVIVWAQVPAQTETMQVTVIGHKAYESQPAHLPPEWLPEVEPIIPLVITLEKDGEAGSKQKAWRYQPINKRQPKEKYGVFPKRRWIIGIDDVRFDHHNERKSSKQIDETVSIWPGRLFWV